MNEHIVLAKVKRLVGDNRFMLVRRRATHAKAVTRALAKEIIAQLSISDFRRRDFDRDDPDEYVWIFKTEFGAVYYIKFKFMKKDSREFVKFISLHLDA